MATPAPKGLPMQGTSTPPAKPGSGTVYSADPMYAEAVAQAKAALAAQTAPLAAQQAASDAYYASRQGDATANATALQQLLSKLNIGGSIQGAYQTAAQDQDIMGQAFAHGQSDALNGSADGINALLDKIGAPSGQQVGGNIPAAGEALAGINGLLPAQSFEKAGAAQAAAADVLPGIALLQGQENYKSIGAQGITAHADFDNKIAALAGNLPGDIESNYQALYKIAQTDRAFAQKVAQDKVSNALAARKVQDAETNANNANYWKGVSAKQRDQSLQLQANKFAREQFQQDRQYNVSLARLGIAQKGLQLRIAAAAFTQAHGGYSTKDVNRFNQKMDAILAGAGSLTKSINGVYPTAQWVDKNGKPITLKPGQAAPTGAHQINTATYGKFIAAALKKGVPVQLAIQRANTIWPETQREDLGSLMSLPAVAAQAAQQARDYAKTTGQILGTSPNGVDIHYAVSGTLSKAGKATVSGVLGLAQEYLGTPYAWGGESPTGFDCSGLAQYIYAKEGVNIPRTTYDQFQSGLNVPRSQLQAGDLVFFRGSDSRTVAGRTLPGHVGIYIGGGKFVEAPHTGDVVKVSSLAGYPGFMGARRYVH